MQQRASLSAGLPSYKATSAAILLLTLLLFLLLYAFSFVQVDLAVLALAVVLDLLFQVITDFCCQCLEQFGDVYVVLRACFHMPDTVLLGQFLPFLQGNLPVGRRTIRLIADDDSTNVFAVVLANLFQPVLDVRKGLTVSHRIHLN